MMSPNVTKELFSRGHIHRLWWIWLKPIRGLSLFLSLFVTNLSHSHKTKRNWWCIQSHEETWSKERVSWCSACSGRNMKLLCPAECPVNTCTLIHATEPLFNSLSSPSYLQISDFRGRRLPLALSPQSNIQMRRTGTVTVEWDCQVLMKCMTIHFIW